MARWTDLAEWVGPSPSITEGGAKECRGLVIHIAEGYYQGTISWQRGKANKVSSHFIIDRDGRTGQMVDTDDKAWTQGDGNGRWLSAEFAGFTLGHRLHRPGWERLSDAQIEVCARLLARCHEHHGVPLQMATSPSGRGLGHHSMGGKLWGHLDCPGNPIIAQKPQIVARAVALLNPHNTPEDIVDQKAVEDFWQHYIAVDGLNLQDHLVQGGAAAKRAEAAVGLLAAKVDSLDAKIASLGTPTVSVEQVAALKAEILAGLGDVVEQRLRAVMFDAGTPG